MLTVQTSFDAQGHFNEPVDRVAALRDLDQLLTAAIARVIQLSSELHAVGGMSGQMMGDLQDIRRVVDDAWHDQHHKTHCQDCNGPLTAVDSRTKRCTTCGLDFVA